MLQPATWGVSHGSGFLGDQVRKAELEMSQTPQQPSGDREASWAGHAFVYVGLQAFHGNLQPAIVQAEYPKVLLSPVTAHADAIWAVGQPLTPQQRDAGVREALSMVGESYDIAAYALFMAKLFHVMLDKDLTHLLADFSKIGPICSGTVVREQAAMGVPLDELRVAATTNPDVISPADLLRWGLNHKWMDKPVPSWS